MIFNRLAVTLMMTFSVLANSTAGADESPHAYRDIKNALKAGRYLDIELHGSVVTAQQGRFLLDIASSDIQRSGMPVDMPVSVRVGQYQLSARVVSRQQAQIRDAYYANRDDVIPTDNEIQLVADDGERVELNTWTGRTVFPLDIRVGDQVSVHGRKLLVERK